MLGRLPGEWRRFDLERADFQVIERDPDAFLRLHEGERLAIDEAQLLPALFLALHVAIDALRSERGRFVVTGSSSPELRRGLSESLAAGWP